MKGPAQSAFRGFRAAVASAFLCLSILLPSVALAQTDLIPDSPVDHFRVFGFDKTTGWRTWQLEGAKAEFPNADIVRIRDMKIRLYQAGGEQKVNLFIESSLAVMQRARQNVDGPETIVVTAKGLYLCGENWSWYPDEHRLLIRQKTHAVIHGAIGPILE
ncbi:MAG TPA: hypothetical protein PKI32_04695 [Opitutales bacterium]|nr:hypothetical protein [Opitutales bacterium]